MIETNHHQEPTLGRLLRRTLKTSVGALHNRAELFQVELEEERARMLHLMISGACALFLGMMTILLLTGTIIFMFDPEYRGYAAGGFTLLYLLATVLASFRLKAVLGEVPFAESAAEIKKDEELLEAFE